MKIIQKWGGKREKRKRWGYNSRRRGLSRSGEWLDFSRRTSVLYLFIFFFIRSRDICACEWNGDKIGTERDNRESPQQFNRETVTPPLPPASFSFTPRFSLRIKVRESIRFDIRDARCSVFRCKSRHTKYGYGSLSFLWEAGDTSRSH